LEPSSNKTSTPTPTQTPKASVSPSEGLPISKGAFNPDSQIDKSTTQITKEAFKDGVEIPLTVTDGKETSLYGTISIPPGLIPVGWTVVITPVNETDLDKPKPSTSSDCDKEKGNSSGGEIRSIAFNMVILDDRGRQRSLQELLQKSKSGEGLGITLAYSLTGTDQKKFNTDDLKFIFLQEGDDAWQLAGDQVTISGSGEGFGNISTTVDHLTSIPLTISHLFQLRRLTHKICEGFAVLLGAGGSLGGPCSDNTIWILSVSFLAATCALSFVVIVLFSKVPFLNRHFSGFRRRAKSMKDLEKHIARRTQTFSNTNSGTSSSIGTDISRNSVRMSPLSSSPV